jgi:integrase
VAKTTDRLTALQVKKLSKPGVYPDGNGLYLQVSKSGSKSWFYRYERGGKQHKYGLGSYIAVPLDMARKKAQECRAMLDEGIDPIQHKREQEAELRLQSARGMTFEECAHAYIEAHKAGWKNRKHESQWRNTLKTYAYPKIGGLSVQDVDVPMVMQVLEPIWYDKTETASRVRQRIENILDWAKVRGYRSGENPALWRGHLDKLLPKRSKVQKVRHFNAMPYADVPDYYRQLRQKDTVAARALAFVILTATRNGEARGVRWDELDLRHKVLNIPAERMKAERPHRIPLSDEAMAIIEQMKSDQQGEFVFPGQRNGKPVSEAALLKLLKQTHPTLTIHGFRSSFRDWCAEMTNFPREVAEAALAHTLKDKTEAAYQRGDMFEKRRKLMEAWSGHCRLTGKKAEVLSINKKFNLG